MRDELLEGRITESIIGAFFAVFNELGFGLLERLYSMAMERELRDRGHEVAREVWIPVFYKGVPLGKQRIDLIVDRKVIVELKSGLELHPAAIRQCLNYLRVSRLEVGLVLHFGPKPGIKRLISRKDVAFRLTDIRRQAAGQDPGADQRAQSLSGTEGLSR